MKKNKLQKAIVMLALENQRLKEKLAKLKTPKSEPLTAQQLASQYPDRSQAWAAKFDTLENFIGYADANGWRFGPDGKIVMVIPDDELVLSVKQLKTYYPRSLARAKDRYQKLCKDIDGNAEDFEQVAAENNWMFYPNGDKV